PLPIARLLGRAARVIDGGIVLESALIWGARRLLCWPDESAPAGPRRPRRPRRGWLRRTVPAGDDRRSAHVAGAARRGLLGDAHASRQRPRADLRGEAALPRRPLHPCRSLPARARGRGQRPAHAPELALPARG